MKEGHLEPGRYRILNAASSDVVNIIRRRSTEEPTICTWNAHNSYTDKWLLVPVAEGGYYIRNEASGHYFSLARPSSVLNDGDPVIGSTTPTKWAIGKNDSSFRVSPMVEPSLEITVNNNPKHEGKELLLRRKTVKEEGSASKSTARVDEGCSEWTFVQDFSDEPPSYSGNVHLGPIPPGLYWLGQAEIINSVAPIAARCPTVGALTVAARSLDHSNSTSPLHLSAISGDDPWHHQIWMIELGKRGYRLKNIGANAYLTIVNREVVAEVCTLGSSYSEWSISIFPKRDTKDIESYTISPVTDLSCSLATHFRSLFYKVEVKQILWWHKFWHVEWRLYATKPELLKPLDVKT